MEIFISFQTVDTMDIFIDSLLSRLKRYINKNYIEAEDNLVFVKGKILVSETKEEIHSGSTFII